MPRIKLILLAAVVAFTAWAAMSLASRLNIGFQFSAEQLKSYNKLENCRSHFRAADAATSTHMAPAEDIEVDLETDVAFLGVSDVQAIALKRNVSFHGNILTWTQSTENMVAPRRLSVNFKGDEVPYYAFNPLGISLLRFRGFEPNFGFWVFSVNYDHMSHTQSVIINKYNYESSTTHGFTQEYNFKSNLFENLNDVAAISPTEFYVSNHHTGPGSSTPLCLILDLMNIPTGNVLYCNVLKRKCKIVLDGLSYANSVYLNHDHTKLYVTESGEKRFSVYNRDIVTSELSLNETIQFDSLLDNINVDPWNNVWIAATMDAVATLRAITDTTKEFKSAPSIVYRLVPKSGLPNEQPSKWNHPSFQSNNFWVEIVYADNGSNITPLSVAAPTRLGEVILSSLVSPDLVRCTIPDAK
jgi:hypothetical protein